MGVGFPKAELVKLRHTQGWSMASSKRARGNCPHVGSASSSAVSRITAQNISKKSLHFDKGDYQVALEMPWVELQSDKVKPGATRAAGECRACSCPVRRFLSGS